VNNILTYDKKGALSKEEGWEPLLQWIVF